jgi:hypothetical protein
MVWSGTVSSVPLAPAEMASFTRLTPRLGSTRHRLEAVAPSSVALASNEVCRSMKYLVALLLMT